MFSGATTLSRAGQYRPDLASGYSEALNALDVSDVTRYLLPSAQMPHRRSQEAMGNDLATWWKGYQDDQRKEDQRHVSALEKQEQLELQIAKIHTSGDETTAIQRTYQMRLDYAQRIYDLETKTVGESAARDKFDERNQDAQIERATEMAQLDEKRYDAIKKQSSGLYETLFTNPGKFGSQLSGTLKNAALKPITEGLGGLTANFLYPMLYGARGGGINDVHLVDGAVPVHIVNIGSRALAAGGGFSSPVVNASFSPVSGGGFSPVGGFDGAAATPFIGGGFSPVISSILGAGAASAPSRGGLAGIFGGRGGGSFNFSQFRPSNLRAMFGLGPNVAPGTTVPGVGVVIPGMGGSTFSRIAIFARHASGRRARGRPARERGVVGRRTRHGQRRVSGDAGRCGYRVLDWRAAGCRHRRGRGPRHRPRGNDRGRGVSAARSQATHPVHLWYRSAGTGRRDPTDCRHGAAVWRLDLDGGPNPPGAATDRALRLEHGAEVERIPGHAALGKPDPVE